MNSIQVAIIISVFFQLSILIAVYWWSPKVTLQSYVSDDRIYSWWKIALTTTGTIVGGGMFIGISKVGYEAGFYGVLLGLVYLVGFFMFSSYAGKLRNIMEEKRCLTLNELIEKRFSYRVMWVFSVTNFIIYLCLLSAQFLAIHAIYKFFIDMGVSIEWSILPGVVALVCMLTYPVFGGLRRDIVSDLLQWIFIGLGLIIFVMLLIDQGIPSDLGRIPATHWTGAGYGIVLVIATVVFLVPTFFVRTDLWQRANAARSEKDLVIGLRLAGLISFFSYIVFTLVGMSALANGVVSSERASVEFLRIALSDKVIFGFVLGGFVAAVLSTADTYINNMTIHLESIFDKNRYGNNIKSRVRRLQAFSFVLVLAALGLALWFQDIVDVFVASFSLLIIFMIPILGLWNDNWSSEQGAFWGMLLGLVGFSIGLMLLSPKIAFIPAVTICLLVQLIFRFLGRPVSEH